MRSAAVLLFVALLLAGPAAARDTARVESVVDGDTIRVLMRGERLTIRLIGVDTPELGDRADRGAPPQPYAREAAAFTRARLRGRSVELAYEAGDRHDRYGRTLAYVFLADGTFFNRELLRQGYARAYARGPFRYRDAFLADEAAARRAGRGLWGLTPAGPVIGNRRSRLYHLPGQAHYDDIAPANRVYFPTEDAARAAGYAPAMDRRGGAAREAESSR
ncbi:thermonuclease family protein [bacterium]|nr:thermonuclease family protein [bacterium]